MRGYGVGQRDFHAVPQGPPSNRGGRPRSSSFHLVGKCLGSGPIGQQGPTGAGNERGILGREIRGDALPTLRAGR